MSFYFPKRPACSGTRTASYLKVLNGCPERIRWADAAKA